MRVRTSYASSVVSIALVLFLFGLFGLFVIDAKKISDMVKERFQLSLTLNDGVKEADIGQFKKSLDAEPYVLAAEYITKEQAARNLQKDLGSEDFLSILDYNPLPASIEIRLHAEFADPANIEKIKKELSKNKYVKEVEYKRSLLDSMNENIKSISLVILFFFGILLLISIALINNTIRLNIYSKRFLIRSMQLVGATRAFIRRPFILKGIMHGIYSSIVAIALLVAVLYIAPKKIPDLEQVEIDNMDWYGLLFGIVLLLGILISWVCTWLAVRKYLRLRTDDLYL